MEGPRPDGVSQRRRQPAWVRRRRSAAAVASSVAPPYPPPGRGSPPSALLVCRQCRCGLAEHRPSGAARFSVRRVRWLPPCHGAQNPARRLRHGLRPGAEQHVRDDRPRVHTRVTPEGLLLHGSKDGFGPKAEVRLAAKQASVRATSSCPARCGRQPRGCRSDTPQPPPRRCS